MFRQDNVLLVEFFEGGKSMFWPWRRHVVSCLVCSLGEHRGHEPHRMVEYCTEGQDKDALLYCHPLWFGGQTKSVLFLWHLVSNAWTHTRIGCDGCMLPFSLSCFRDFCNRVLCRAECRQHIGGP